MRTMVAQIIGVSIVYATVCSGADKKHRRSASLAFVRGIRRWPANSPHKGPVTRRMFPFDDVIMWWRHHVVMSFKLPFSHIESDNEFIVTLQQFMGSALIPGAELLTPDSMIFDPFEINEIEDEIIEFHGEQHPYKNYFNQFSHQLSKSSNYYIEDSFNKYVKRNCQGTGNLSFIHPNIQSIPANFNAFMSYMLCIQISSGGVDCYYCIYCTVMPPSE